MLFLGIIVTMCISSTVILISCLDITEISRKELLNVKDSYERVALTASSRSQIRTIINVATGIEPNESELTSDRDALYRQKFNVTIEKLRYA